MYKKFDRLTPAEQDFIKRHPWDAMTINSDAEKALDEAAKRYGRGSLHNGAGDAFRHCYWNALMTRDVGKDEAVEFGNAHESNPGNPADEKDMDLHNNAVGVSIGEANPNATDEQLAQACSQALLDGKLKVLKP